MLEEELRYSPLQIFNDGSDKTLDFTSQPSDIHGNSRDRFAEFDRDILVLHVLPYVFEQAQFLRIELAQNFRLIPIKMTIDFLTVQKEEHIKLSLRLRETRIIYILHLYTLFFVPEMVGNLMVCSRAEPTKKIGGDSEHSSGFQSEQRIHLA